MVFREKDFQVLNELFAIYDSKDVFVTEHAKDDEGRPYGIIASPKAPKICIFTKESDEKFTIEFKPN